MDRGRHRILSSRACCLITTIHWTYYWTTFLDTQLACYISCKCILSYFLLRYTIRLNFQLSSLATTPCCKTIPVRSGSLLCSIRSSKSKTRPRTKYAQSSSTWWKLIKQMKLVTMLARGIFNVYGSNVSYGIFCVIILHTMNDQ